MTVPCALARLRTRSDYGSLDFFAPLFASRQKVEKEKFKRKSKKNRIKVKVE
jgi:hypothetical protein